MKSAPIIFATGMASTAHAVHGHPAGGILIIFFSLTFLCTLIAQSHEK